MSFVGCKLALIHGAHILTYLRDDKPGLHWANMWDLPGGGREGDETPEACVLRELHEEFGLTLARRTPDLAARISVHDGCQPPVAFLCRPDHPGRDRRDPLWRRGSALADDASATFLAHPTAVPELQRRTGSRSTELGWL